MQNLYLLERPFSEQIVPLLLINDLQVKKLKCFLTQKHNSKASFFFFFLECDADWNWVIVSITQDPWCWGKSAGREGDMLGSCLPFPYTVVVFCFLLKHGASLKPYFCLVVSWARRSCCHVMGRTHVLCPMPKGHSPKLDSSISESSSCYRSWHFRLILHRMRGESTVWYARKRSIEGVQQGT